MWCYVINFDEIMDTSVFPLVYDKCDVPPHIGVRRGGGQGAGHMPPLDLDVCKNVGLLWQFDCLLFVLSRSSSIYVNYIQLYHYCSLKVDILISVKISGRNETA